MGERKAASPPPVIFDTDILIWYFRGSEEARDFIRGVPFSERILIAPVYMELIQGCRDRREMAKVREFARRNFTEVIMPEEEDASMAVGLLEHYTLSHGLYGWDAFIAAMALRRKAVLATGNVKHYRFIKGLELVTFERGVR